MQRSSSTPRMRPRSSVIPSSTTQALFYKHTGSASGQTVNKLVCRKTKWAYRGVTAALD